MLSDDIARYISLRRSLGFRIRLPECLLRRFEEFARSRGESIVRSQTAVDWATQAPSVHQRRERLNVVRRFALHMQAEDQRYEVPPVRIFGNARWPRRIPHLYTEEEVQALLRAAARLTPRNSMRPTTYVALLSLLFATGLRISEALSLQLDDITSDGLVVRQTKFRKSRLVPLHPTARAGLERYVACRQKVVPSDQSVFISLWGTRLHYATACSTFLQIARAAGLRGRPGTPGPRIHDARHTFAARALESSGPSDSEVARHVLALSTYLGHAHPSDTYWYLHVTPMLAQQIASSSEMLFTRGRS